MSSLAHLLGIRVRAENPNHHLWNNHGTWFLHYTVHPTPYTKERVRRSLGTKDLEVARARRDSFFDQFEANATRLATGSVNKQVAA
jgi:hypothetical protein